MKPAMAPCGIDCGDCAVYRAAFDARQAALLVPWFKRSGEGSKPGKAPRKSWRKRPYAWGAARAIWPGGAGIAPSGFAARAKKAWPIAENARIFPARGWMTGFCWGSITPPRWKRSRRSEPAKNRPPYRRRNARSYRAHFFKQPIGKNPNGVLSGGRLTLTSCLQNEKHPRRR